MSLRDLAASILWTISVSGLAVAGVLLCVSAMAPTWPQAIELVALVPFGFPLAGLALVVALGLVPLTRGVARWLAAALAIVALVAAALAFSVISPLFVGQKPAADTQGALVVMVQNIENGDADSLAARALQAHVDVLVVSDASASTGLHLQTSELGRELCYLVGTGPSGPQGSVVLSRYPLTDVARISASGASRVVTAHTPQLGEVDLLALHPRPPYQKGAWAADYAQVTTYLVDHYAASPSTPNRQIVIAGDLNATLDHAPIRQIRTLGFTDAVDQLNLGFQPTWPAAGARRLMRIPIPPLAQIDHVLTSPALVATGLTRFQIAGADHLGLYVAIERARS